MKKLGQTATSVFLVLILVGFFIGAAFIISGRPFPLTVINPCSNNPCLATDPGYPANGATIFSYNVQGDSTAGGVNTESLNLANCSDGSGLGVCSVYSANGGNLYVPAGIVGDSHHIVYCAFGSCGSCPPAGDSCSNAYWAVQDPPGISLGCVPNIGPSAACSDIRGNDLVASTSGAAGGILLTSATPIGDPSCSPNGGTPDQKDLTTCWAADYQLVSAAQAINPPCLAGVTECLRWTVTSNMTVANAVTYLTANPPPGNETIQQAIGKNYGCGTCASNVVQTSGSTWYLYRLITDLILSYSPPAVSVKCLVGDCNSCATFLGAPTAWCPDNGQLTSIATNQFLPELNSAATIKGTQIVFGVSVNGLAAQCPTPVQSTCFLGIGGMWLGGQSLQTSGCASTTVSCSISNANYPHFQFPLYSCAALTSTCIANTPSAQDVIQLAQITNSTIQQVQQASLYSTVYSHVDIGSLGAPYSIPSGGCMVGSLSQCINSPTAMFINVPLLYDVIGSYTNYYYTYPGIPPNGGAIAGTIQGHVYGVGTGFAGLSNSGINNACVGLGGPCSGYVGQLQATSLSSGAYTFGQNVPPGSYQVSASATGFVGQSQFGVKVAVGQVAVVDFTLTPVNPPGEICLIQPSYSPLPPYSQIFPGICIPSWIAWGLLIGGGILAFLLILGSPAGGLLAGGIARSLRLLASRGGTRKR